jgi:hypothetical protein
MVKVHGGELGLVEEKGQEAAHAGDDSVVVCMRVRQGR